MLVYRMISNYIVTLVGSPRRNWSQLGNLPRHVAVAAVTLETLNKKFTLFSPSFSGMLTYRLFRNERKKKLKLIHMGVMLASFLLTVIGLKAVFDSHDLAATPIPNLYSLHSWVGIVTVVLFACQWVAGFVTFLFPGLASHLRASYMPLHTSFGVMIFVLACATALMGITEKLIFTLKYVIIHGRAKVSYGHFRERFPFFRMIWVVSSRKSHEKEALPLFCAVAVKFEILNGVPNFN